jgi:hypothetical protein
MTGGKWIVRDVEGRGRDGSVGIMMDYGLDGQGSIPGGGEKFLSTAQRQGRLWGPLSLLFNGYLGKFSWGERGRIVKLTIHLHRVPMELLPPLPIRLHGMVINYLTTGIILFLFTGRGRERWWPNRGTIPQHFPAWSEENHENHSQDSRCPGRDFEPTISRMQI